MNTLDDLKHNIGAIERKIGYTFLDKNLLILAFTHRSFVNENKGLVDQHNERLEFLGDSVLGLLISEYLYKYLPSTPEGELSHLRARLVEATSCISYVEKLELEPFILLGRGERMNDGRGRETILSDLFEAIVGAIFLDGGIDATRRFLFQTFSKEIEAILKKPESNWKALLQDYVQKKYQQPPIYEVVSEEGPDHNKTFVVRVLINQKETGRGGGTSKKEAQQAAAKEALKNLNEEITDG